MQAMSETARVHFSIKGVVQGVGFRPFVYNLATSLGLSGWVYNTGAGVEVEVEGEAAAVLEFSDRVRKEPPPLALIEDLSATRMTPIGLKDFVIKESEAGQERFTFISPDTATCPACLKELLDPSNRRYRYPFINCTHCGPRYTIIKDVPYDRPMTTMAPFAMCPDCEREYHDPVNRRFHAQPNACPACGPQAILLNCSGEKVHTRDPVGQAARLLAEGHILAVKGIGGYHLVCDALNREAVQRLRMRKHRVAKPFAVMMNDLETVKKQCTVSREEEKALCGPGRPIVLLRIRKRNNTPVVPEVAPLQQYLGVMLPYAPIHHLLLEDGPEVVVMTSGNTSGEAIEYIDEEAIVHLGTIADYFLTHNRDIHIRTDDSVLRVFKGKEMMIRRSRGYVPMPVKFPFETGSILALGAELKNTVCLSKGNLAFLSQHIGDLETLSNTLAFEHATVHLQRMFNIAPEAVAYDLHPDYISSKFAENLRGLPAFPIQHHHAHIASCMAENGWNGDVIGVAFDGTGYGTDGNIWGGEFFAGNYSGFTRWAHLAYIPLPGGAAAIKQPWRMAVSYLVNLLGEDTLEMLLPVLRHVDQDKLDAIRKMARHGSGQPVTSSAGRLFDGVSALLGICGEISYEGQAAVELEQIAMPDTDCPSYEMILNNDVIPWQIELGSLFHGLADDLATNRPAAIIAARFHKTMAELIAVTCAGIRKETGIGCVALSGGVFQNILLLSQTVRLLEKDGFTVYTHSRIPANDGGISLGQAVMAAVALKNS